MLKNLVEILLVEDNPNDVELTLHTLKKHNLGNFVKVVRDGAEALEFLFCAGAYADRQIEHRPHVVLRPETAEGGRAGGAAPDEGRSIRAHK